MDERPMRSVVPYPSDPPASPERATGSRWRAGAVFPLPSVPPPTDNGEALLQSINLHVS